MVNSCMNKFIFIPTGYSGVTEIEELAELSWFTVQTLDTALLCSKGVLTCSWNYWIFLLTLLSGFRLNV